MNPKAGCSSGHRAVRVPAERELCIDNLLVRIHFIIEMIWWTGLAPWEFEFTFPGSLISTCLVLFLLLLSAAVAGGSSGHRAVPARQLLPLLLYYSQA